MKTDTRISLDCGSVPFFSIGIAFVVLKLMGFITWSWWWVLSPLWISFIIILVLVAIIFYIAYKSIL
jgi:hypothetical protein